MNDVPTPSPHAAPLSPPLLPEEREILVQLYVNAIESSDDAAIERALLAAQGDAVLARQLDEIDLALVAEMPPIAGAKLQAATEAGAETANRKYLVRSLLQKHFPESFEPRPAPDLGPLLVGEVAARVEDEGPILPADREALRQLQEDASPLPVWLSMDAVREVAARLQEKSGAVASEKFWRRFKDAAIFTGMRRTLPQAQLGLAREESRRRRSIEKAEPQAPPPVLGEEMGGE